jgi:hypothetical protein
MSEIHVGCLHAEWSGCIFEYKVVGVFEIVLEMVESKLLIIVVA